MTDLTRVDLGYRSVAIVRRPIHELDGLVGKFLATSNVIEIADGLPPIEELHTLVHELLHLVYAARQVSREDDEERVVGELADGVTELLIRNPDLGPHLERLARRGRP